jgi:hypothetical protein
MARRAVNWMQRTERRERYRSEAGRGGGRAGAVRGRGGAGEGQGRGGEGRESEARQGQEQSGRGRCLFQQLAPLCVFERAWVHSTKRECDRLRVRLSVALRTLLRQTARPCVATECSAPAHQTGWLSSEQLVCLFVRSLIALFRVAVCVLSLARFALLVRSAPAIDRSRCKRSTPRPPRSPRSPSVRLRRLRAATSAARHTTTATCDGRRIEESPPAPD